MGKSLNILPMKVSIDLHEDEIEKLERFRAQVIKYNSVHGTNDTVEWFRTMSLEKLAQIHYRTILAKIK